MQYRKVGNSDLSVSVIGFGCWGIAGGEMWGPQNESDSVAALQAAADSGITFFDTAEAYGDGYSEEITGRALASRRSSVVIATKVGPTHLEAKDLTTACEQSLSRLGTDRIDLYQIHWPEPEANFDEVAATLVRLREAGKIRYVGVSNFDESDLAPYPDDLFVSNQMSYSLAFRAIEFSVIPCCKARGLSIIPYSVLLHGVLAGRFESADDVPVSRARTRHFGSTREQTRHGEQGHEELLFSTVAKIHSIAGDAGLPMRTLAILWIASQPSVATIPVGSRTEAQALSNAAVGDLSLDNETMARLSDATESLKQEMGPSPDMWASPGRIGRT